MMARWQEFDESGYESPSASARMLGLAILWTLGVLVAVLAVVFYLMAR